MKVYVTIPTGFTRPHVFVAVESQSVKGWFYTSLSNSDWSYQEGTPYQNHWYVGPLFNSEDAAFETLEARYPGGEYTELVFSAMTESILKVTP